MTLLTLNLLWSSSPLRIILVIIWSSTSVWSLSQFQLPRRELSGQSTSTHEHHWETSSSCFHQVRNRITMRITKMRITIMIMIMIVNMIMRIMRITIMLIINIIPQSIQSLDKFRPLFSQRRDHRHKSRQWHQNYRDHRHIPDTRTEKF